MLTNKEHEDLDYFQKLELNCKLNISNRINLEKNRMNAEKFAKVDQITTTLNNLRFAHQIVFDNNPKVFFDAVNYTFRAIGEKTVEMKIFVFLMNTAYVISVKQVMNHIMTENETLLLLQMTNISTSLLEDMDRMKNMLYNLIDKNFSTVTVFSYLKLILRFTGESNTLFSSVIDLAMILSTSCELTRHSVGCQALSIVSWVARHIDINSEMKKKLSTLPPIPTLFFSPSRINQFSSYLKISQNQINDCCHDMQLFYIKYYTTLCNRKITKTFHAKVSTVDDEAILEESETESESKNYLGYTFKPMRRLLQSNNRNADGHGVRSKSKHRLRSIRKCRTTSR